MTLPVLVHANKKKHIQESDKIFFPNRDVLLFLFGINSNITYSTKHMNSDILDTQCLKLTIYFSYFFESICNVQKLTLWSVFKHPDVL